MFRLLDLLIIAYSVGIVNTTFHDFSDLGLPRCQLAMRIVNTSGIVWELVLRRVFPVQDHSRKLSGWNLLLGQVVMASVDVVRHKDPFKEGIKGRAAFRMTGGLSVHPVDFVDDGSDFDCAGHWSFPFGFGVRLSNASYYAYTVGMFQDHFSVFFKKFLYTRFRASGVPGLFTLKCRLPRHTKPIGKQMAILKPYNEFFKESVVMALEPAKKCICHCTFCFAELNKRFQWNGKTRDDSDPSTFESTLSKAFSPEYDPTNFSQWGIRNKLVLAYSNTVEPFQDDVQAKSILKTCDKFSIPLFIQTKGVNFFEVWDYLVPFHDNSTLFVSFPTDNDLAIRRFEPGTPLSAHRFKVIEQAASKGFHVILALSPYHESWCKDPVSFLRRTRDAGVSSVFFDRLHLNQRQRKVATDKVMVSMADRSESQDWPAEALEHYRMIHETCGELDLGIFATGQVATVYGYHSTLASISPVGVYKRGLQWPYHDGTLFFLLENNYLDMYESGEIDIRNRDFKDSTVVLFSDVLRIMEGDDRAIEQEFSYSSMSDLMAFKQMPKVWIDSLRPTAKIRDYYRALWNNPSKRQFAWSHPWAKIAMKPDGSPWTDDSGNIVMIFDPDLKPYPSKEREVEDISEYRFLDFHQGVS